MRSYIFTDSERKRLIQWLQTGEEDDTTRMIFVAVRRNTNHLTNDLNLLRLTATKLRAEGRWMGKTRLPKRIMDRLKTLGYVTKTMG
jgi:hypothetical protein